MVIVKEYGKDTTAGNGKIIQDTDDDGCFPRRTGGVGSCLSHIITAIIGSGVLSLGFAVAQVGWIFGPILMLMFAGITLSTSLLLCEAYRTGDPLTGKRHPTYTAAVNDILGKSDQIFCAIIQYSTQFFAGVGYCVTSSVSLVAAKRAICFHEHRDVPPTEAPCSFESTPWTILFGGICLVCSQIPRFGHLSWLSYIATACSFAYSFIGLGLGLGKTTESGHVDYGTALGANVHNSPATSVWNIFLSVGSIAAAYSFSLVLVEIQDTIRQPDPAGNPKAARSEICVMKKAVVIGTIITTAFYCSVGFITYGGLGNHGNVGNLVTGFGFFNPYWLVAAANVFVFVHLIGGFEVFMQPLMAASERLIRRTLPRVAVLHYEVWYEVPVFEHIVFSPLMLINRTVIVVVAVVIASLLPFFNAVVAWLGALCFGSLTVYFPVQMWLKVHKIPKGDRRYILLNGLCVFAFLISLAGAIGAIANIVESVKGYTPFRNKISSIGGGQHSS